MHTFPAVSVIIPLYNAEKYIGECLDSILAQTFQNFEVIVVDDCSTDSSCTIIESYAEKFDGRLTLTHMESNTGSGALPRNKGMMLARGEYITFLDDDDMFTPTAIEEVYTSAKNFNADVVYWEKYYETNSAGANIQVTSYQSGGFVDKPVFETENLAKRLEGIQTTRYLIAPWCKLVQHKLIFEHEIFFPNVLSSDDDVWTYGLLFYAKKFLRVPNIINIRRLSEGSIMRKKRTPQQTINFWLSPILEGLKHLDELMRRHKFFQQNPQYRYAILEMFIGRKFFSLFKDSLQISAFEIYTAIQKEYGNKFSEYDVLISALCTALNTQMKINFSNQQKFNQFAAQAQARIAQLEAEVKRLQT